MGLSSTHSWVGFSYPHVLSWKYVEPHAQFALLMRSGPLHSFGRLHHKFVSICPISTKNDVDSCWLHYNKVLREGCIAYPHADSRTYVTGDLFFSWWFDDHSLLHGKLQYLMPSSNCVLMNECVARGSINTEAGKELTRSIPRMTRLSSRMVSADTWWTLP